MAIPSMTAIPARSRGDSSVPIRSSSPKLCQSHRHRVRIGASITVASSASLPNEKWSEGWDNVECRNQNDERNPNPEIRIGWADRASGMPPRLQATKERSSCVRFRLIRASEFEILSSFWLRHSSSRDRLAPPRTRGNQGTSDTDFRVDP